MITLSEIIRRNNSTSFNRRRLSSTTNGIKGSRKLQLHCRSKVIHLTKSSSIPLKLYISAKVMDHQYLLNYETVCFALMNSSLLTKTITWLLNPVLLINDMSLGWAKVN
ncbi:MAG: hypothetical protein ACTS4W_00345 [Candidatus Hodgkinia cicadicola]